MAMREASDPLGVIAVKNIVVTGGSGKAGRAVVRDLVEHGYDVLNVDIIIIVLFYSYTVLC
jgi:NADP-dependent 3-hydroxy acid dehydrogenase YdfG